MSLALGQPVLDQWTLIIGFLMPNLVSVINQSHWSSCWKTVMAGLICLVTAVIELSLKGQLQPANVAVSALSILALSITFFKGFWRPLGVSDALSNATDVSAPSSVTSLSANNGAREKDSSHESS